MPAEFYCYPDPPPEILEQVSSLAPENTFCTPEYVKARQGLGSRPIAFGLHDGDRFLSACVGFSFTGRINTRLEITSVPVIANPSVFWDGLLRFCRKSRVTILSVYSFGSLPTAIPKLSGETIRKDRTEYRLELSERDLWSGLHRRHQRHVRKARNAGMVIKRNTGSEARRLHTNLANLSLARRTAHGETLEGRIEIDDTSAYLDNKCGELFQSEVDGKVTSSILVLRSEAGAYAQTSGTSDEGRTLGSSQFMFFETANILKHEGIEIFNLGGTDLASSGLQEFKASFGAKRIDLQTAEFYVGGPARRLLDKVAGFFKLS